MYGKQQAPDRRLLNILPICSRKTWSFFFLAFRAIYASVSRCADIISCKGTLVLSNYNNGHIRATSVIFDARQTRTQHFFSPNAHLPPPFSLDFITQEISAYIEMKDGQENTDTMLVTLFCSRFALIIVLVLILYYSQLAVQEMRFAVGFHKKIVLWPFSPIQL